MAATMGMGTAPPRPVIFGCTPALARINGVIIDYETKEGAALCRDGVKGLCRDREEPFGLSKNWKAAKGWDIFKIVYASQGPFEPCRGLLTNKENV